MNEGKKNATCLYQFCFLMHNTENRVNSVLMLFFFLFLTNNVKNTLRKELDEQKTTFMAIKNRLFAPYFESEFSKEFFQEKVMQLKTG